MTLPTHAAFPSLRHLQITCTPQHYQQLLQRYARPSGLFIDAFAGADYWAQVPTYTVSRCPFCATPYTARLDTHSLISSWLAVADRWQHIGNEAYEHHDCPHFVAVQAFINLHGQIPTERRYYENELDVPFVMPPFVPKDVPSYAVLHSLPNCRIEHDRFVPRYSVYIMTYYAQAPGTLWSRRRAELDAYYRIEPDGRTPVLFSSAEATTFPESWDLRLWVVRRKLQWLDPTTDDLALRAGFALDLPYAEVQGYRHPIIIRHGQITSR